MPAPCGCEGASLAATIREDVDRYLFGVERAWSPRTGLIALLRVAVLSPGLWAVLSYRVTHHAFTRIRPARLGHAIGLLLQLTQRIVLAITGIDLDPRAHIGPGLMIPHSGFIVVGPVRIGRNCDISQGATLGHSTTEEDPGKRVTPVLEDRVWVGPGAVIAGGIHVGADAAIGANSVLVRDVPPCGVVLGVPARLVSQRGSFAQVAYRGMNEDVERLAARSHAEAAGSAKATGSKPTAAKATGSKPTAAKATGTKGSAAKPVDAKPVDAKPVDAKPLDAKPVDAKPTGTPPIDGEPSEPTSADPKAR
jgi:serine O-acetyltransferase